MDGPLTDEAIEAILSTRPRQRMEVTDPLEPGLRLRFGAEGIAWSVLTYTLGGGRVRVPVGAWPAVRASEARAFALAFKASFQQARTPNEAELSLRSLLDRYDTRRLSQLKKGRVIGRALRVTLESVLHHEASAVSRREISALIDDMADRAPTHANRVLAYAKAFFSWSVGRGYLEANPAASISKPTRERPRERTPTLAEIRDIWRAAGSLAYPFGPIFRLLILTAGRREEVGAMRQAEVEFETDGEEACWTLPAERSKNGRAIRVPLPAMATRILRDVQTDGQGRGPFFFSTTGLTPVSGWSRAKARLDGILAADRRQRKIPPIAAWRLHDLRRSFATAACDLLKIDPAVADRCRNHIGASTTSTISRVYARNEMFDQRREALRAWGELVTTALDASDCDGAASLAE